MILSLIIVYGAIAFTLLLILFLLQFYRDPKRAILKGKTIVSPADGKVVRIDRIKTKKTTVKKGKIGKIQTLVSDIGTDCYVISIFMSPFDCHYNRAPVAGTIKSTKHTKGKFFAAYDLEKSLLNEKNEIIIQNKEIGKVKVIQIAGFLARRILCFVKKNQKVNKGSKVGQIVLGSQATIIFSAKKTSVCVKKGEQIYAGSSTIAQIN